MNRRTFLKRALVGVGVVGVGAEAAKALVHCPEVGQPVPVGQPYIKPPEPIKSEPWPTTHWWERPIEWLGDPLDHNKPLSEWIGADTTWTEEEFDSDMEFYFGKQWPDEALAAREKNYRPSLTVNMVKGIVDRAVIVSRQRDETTDLSYRDWNAVIVNVIRRNRDAQLHYNAMQSARLEMKMLDVKKRVIIRSRIHDYDLAGQILAEPGVRYEHLWVDPA